MKNDRVVNFRVPRENRTPFTEAVHASNVAMNVFLEIVERVKIKNPSDSLALHEDPKELFELAFLAEPVLGPGISGDELVEEFWLSVDGKRDPERSPPEIFHILEIIAAYSVQAINAEKSDKHNEAWTYASDAQYWAGILGTIWGQKAHGLTPAAQMARKRHAENYAIINYARKYWKEKSNLKLSASKAANELANALSIDWDNEHLIKARRQLGHAGAIEKKKRDPKQKEKKLVYECWTTWQKEPNRYPSKAAFARDMLTKCEHLTSQKKIEDWCREWESKGGTQPAE